ncbi:hypothetical protein [Escherichia coli]|uniref:hypothetical protein n=1 Tax=Escherichia coli TaxID=562 RepID=UPI000BE3F353|nr:hypothetical protein [Escherichia coli]MDC6785520.1 hypothetical protein [Escherichia coli]MDC6834942.1 hypothetical protein [Escherichia coli]MDC6896673.1 hypothetical protein [Escherichia coli]MDC7010732.1 hypothetical protein [Escherichia coli]MDC7065419.1 hypothetical protein [Escherichia coli]
MSLFHKVSRLKKNSELFRTRCEQRLHQLSRENAVLEASEASLNAQVDGLRQLLKTCQTEATVISPEQLRALLRKQAVLRCKIQELRAQAQQLQTRRESLLIQSIEQQKKRNHFLRKEETYDRWLLCQKKEMQRCALQRDETEQEENGNGKHYTAL